MEKLLAADAAKREREAYSTQEFLSTFAGISPLAMTAQLSHLRARS